MSSIPASNIVQVNPGVIDAGGASLVLNGVMLTENTAVPIGTVQSFPSATAVSNFFGANSTEANLAAVYFQGRNNATVRPGSLLFFQYAATAVSGYLRSGSLNSLTLADLKATSGTMTVTVDGGSPNTSTTINLSAATSFSNAATIIAAGFTALGATISYDSVRNAFVFTSSTTGATSSVSFGSGTLADALFFTQATGAVTSAGAAATTPTAAMNLLVQKTLNWAAFMTVFEPVTSDKILFSSWTSGQNNRYAYVGWDTDITVTETPPATASWMYSVTQSNYSGTFPVYLDPAHAAFVLGVTASLDFSRTNGRITYAFKYLDGLTPSVTDETTAANLQANGYNFIGQYATANAEFTFLYPGTVSGIFKNMAPYVNQIYFNSQLQLAGMKLLTAINSIPYNAQGYSLIASAFADPITAALNFGTIRTGVPLSALQIAEVNNAAGTKIDDVLSTRGWFLQILPATAEVRVAGGSPPCSLWYMDGGDVRQITLASIVVE